MKNSRTQLTLGTLIPEVFQREVVDEREKALVAIAEARKKVA